ncbi:NACHT, LRR and PYD domains-containing protein 3-like [Notolabrus celidotus]|uniref:NACHT, LRR and PYD domains-containing protein 3-like n=1 Tax=Notolabrus celidotus TaxID=1203425 RepID=UPI00149025C5|nr:NACHT, LRR and PYD domains-containing protein 3-like [Notolabrus celidotus]XP_034534435.1 NACHT, LRR and PYD domains-containing protein 3-like [Notolabrus celidotus]
MSEPGSSEASFAPTLQSHRSKDYPPAFGRDPPGEGGLSGIRKRQHNQLKRRKPEEGSSFSAKSRRTDRSKDYPPAFSDEPVSGKNKAADSSKDYPPAFSKEPGPSRKSDQTTSSILQNPDMLKVLEIKAMGYLRQALKATNKVLSENDALMEEEQEDDDDDAKEGALKIALHILRTMNREEQALRLEQSHYGVTAMYQKSLKSSLRTQSEYLLEVTQTWPVPLKEIYTEVYLMEGDAAEVNREHEVRQIEAAFNKRTSLEIRIKLRDVFKPLPNQQDQPIRTVLTMGIAGIGKTVLTQKFILDWSEEKVDQDIQLLFLLPFRELNLLKHVRRSLMELLSEFSPGLKESGITDLNKCKVLIVLDGLDECRLPLDFKHTENHDPAQPASVAVLLTNLIAGELLPGAHLWITTRPAAASCIPPRYIHRLTEIRGFNNQQKEQYFHKKIHDEHLAKRVIANIKSTRSLNIMCHVPVFCWISSIVLGEICAKVGGGKMPKTLTQMYIHFLTHQTAQSRVKYAKEQELDSKGNNKVIMALGKLAFEQLEKGNLIFYEEDLRECGIDVNEASVYSGVCTQVFREESCMQNKVFCFVHLSVQEFLAALYVRVLYTVSGENLMNKDRVRKEPIADLHKAAVNKALQCDNGHLDLFLRFLLGLSLESSQVLLKGLNLQVQTWDSQSHEETIQHIKGRIDLSEPERYINLLHCLNELNDHTLVEEIQYQLDLDRDMVTIEWSAAQWAALVFLLLTSPERSEEIHLKKYSRTKEGFQKLLPAIKASRSAKLNDCNLTADCCQELSSTLRSSSNKLKHLNLSDNRLEDRGIQYLCTGLQSPNCRLKMLRLNRCDLTQMSCEKLASVLSCPTSGLRELDLSDNDIGDSGVELLSEGLGDVICKVEILRLSSCNITERGCGFLASAVKTNPSHLSELDLSYNHLSDSGVKIICDALDEGRCESKLRVDHNADHWFRPGLKTYARGLTMDPNTAHRLLILSEDNRKVSYGSEEQPYPDHPDRFDYWPQVMSKEGLDERCYWEVEWEGKWATIGVAYKDIKRKGQEDDSWLGYNRKSWGVLCSDKGYCLYHNFESIGVGVPLAGSRRLAMYLDREAGMLSFYRVSSGGSLTHLHTFSTSFTEPLYPTFRLRCKDSSVRLCELQSD